MQAGAGFYVDRIQGTLRERHAGPYATQALADAACATMSDNDSTSTYVTVSSAGATAAEVAKTAYLNPHPTKTHQSAPLPTLK